MLGVVVSVTTVLRRFATAGLQACRTLRGVAVCRCCIAATQSGAVQQCIGISSAGPFSKSRASSSPLFAHVRGQGGAGTWQAAASGHSASVDVDPLKPSAGVFALGTRNLLEWH
jgi:hypothetical protein